MGRFSTCKTARHSTPPSISASATVHLPVLLQRLLQPLNLLLQHYIWVSPRHPPPPISPLTMTASARCRTSDAVLESPRRPWFVSHPCNPSQRIRSSLQSEIPFKMVFKRPMTPWLPYSGDEMPAGEGWQLCHPPQIHRYLPTPAGYCSQLQHHQG